MKKSNKKVKTKNKTTKQTATTTTAITKNSNKNVEIAALIRPKIRIMLLMLDKNVVMTREKIKNNIFAA